MPALSNGASDQDVTRFVAVPDLGRRRRARGDDLGTIPEPVTALSEAVVARSLRAVQRALWMLGAIVAALAAAILALAWVSS